MKKEISKPEANKRQFWVLAGDQIRKKESRFFVRLAIWGVGNLACGRGMDDKHMHGQVSSVRIRPTTALLRELSAASSSRAGRRECVIPSCKKKLIGRNKLRLWLIFLVFLKFKFYFFFFFNLHCFL